VKSPLHAGAARSRLRGVSPIVFKWKEYRFFFFSREENHSRMHIACKEGEVNFWLEPTVNQTTNHGLSADQLRVTQRIVEEKRNVILDEWHGHFSG
jgi:hypothetical protein